MVFVQCISSMTSAKEAAVVVSTDMLTPSIIEPLALINVYEIKTYACIDRIEGHFILQIQLICMCLYCCTKYTFV